MIANKNIIITGGGGFIGSHLFDRLVSNNNYVIVIDNFNNYYEGKEERFKELTKNLKEKEDYELIKGNLVDKSVLNKVDREIDYIFHLAAQAGVRYSIDHALEVSENNIGSTVNVYEYAVENNVGKVIYASSSSVYGNPIYTPLDEDHPKNPISPYALTKLYGELYADYYTREYNLPITSCRFYTVYGPRGRPDMAMRKFFNLILDDEVITIYGDGEQIRDFTFVLDIVNGLVLAAENDKANGEVFNLGCSNPITVNKLVDKMYEIAGKEKNLKYIEKQQGDVDITYSNTDKAKKILNYDPKIQVEEGLEITYHWIKKNREK